MTPDRLPLQRRALSVPNDALDLQARTLTLVASTEETVVERWWGREQLVHSPGAVMMDRAQSPAGIPLLWGHDSASLDALLGRVERFELDPAAKVTRATVRFASTEQADKALRLIQDGALRDVSIGYRIHDIVVLRAGKPDELQRVSRWEPMEVSLVSVPADPKAGIGRSQDPEYPVRRLADSPEPPAHAAGTPEVRVMPDEPNTLTPAAPPAATPTPELRALISPEVRGFLATAEKVFGAEGRRAAEDILGQTQDLGRAGQELLKRYESKPLPAPAPSLEELGASSRELKGYSYARALASLVDQAEGRSSTRGFEQEVSDTLSRKMPLNFEFRGGILVPMQVRALDSATTGGAKELVFTEKGEFIPLLRNASVVLRMGARFLTGLTGPVAFPKQTAAASASWVAENPGSDVASSQFSTGTVTLSPKTLQASTPISRQLLISASEDAESMIREDLAVAHALAYDRAALHGTGADNQPTGIYTAANVNAVAMGGNPTFAKLVEMVTEIAKDNALLGTLGYVTTPGVAGKLMTTLVASAAGSDMVWRGKIEDGQVNGYRAVATNQVASNLGVGTNEHGLICANWAQVLMAQFGPGFELTVDPYSLKKQALVEFTSFQMVDLALRYPQAFAKATGLILS